MDKLAAMGAYAKVVATGSFAEAARRLGVTRSAISKAVMELEHTLGARLLDRTTRRVAPTEAGLAYYERCLAILAQVEETETQISRLHDEPKGVLKVNAPLSFGTRYLGQAIAAFMTRYSDLKVELTLSDRVVDPLEDSVDVLIRIGALSDSNLIARRLGSTTMAILAAPGYLKKHGEPTTTMDLTRHRVLSYGQSTSLQKWILRENGKTTSRSLNVQMASNNGDVLCDAAIAGVGIALLPTFIACDAIADGQLQIIMQDATPPDLDIHALYLPNRYLAAKTRVFIDFLVERFAKNPPWAIVPSQARPRPERSKRAKRDKTKSQRARRSVS